MPAKYWAVPINNDWMEIRCGKKPVLVKKQITLPDRRRVSICCWQGGRKSGTIRRKFVSLQVLGVNAVSSSQVQFWRKEGLLT